jgi:hypothetical protein
MYDRWANETDHPNYNATPPYTFQTFPSANEHLIGTLYIELEGGYNTTVSNIELVSDERGPRLDDLGEYAPLNNSRIMASVGRGSTDYGEDFGMLLGGAWLASTYVFVDYENNKFGLAPAILGSTQSDVKTQCSKDASIPPPQAGANATTSSGSTTKTGTSTSDKIAIGVSIPAGVAAIATLAYMIYEGYRRRQERKQKELREARKLELEEQQKEVAKRQLELNAEEARERKESYTEFRRILSEVSMGSTGAGVSPLGGRSPDIGPSSPASGGEMRDAFGIERRV